MIGILLQAGSVGVYQANIGVIATFTLIMFLKSFSLLDISPNGMSEILNAPI